MASAGSTQAIIKRREDELALMPPPPTKRVKRPAKVLDEDEYTEKLSSIIQRDYFPGLREAKAQDEYLQALESNNPTWIAEAESRLRAATKGEADGEKIRRETRDTRFDTPRSYRAAPDTPRGMTSEETPLPRTDDPISAPGEQPTTPEVDVSSMSLSSYQTKYTSEDNSSFNDLLDKHNEKRRQKHAHLWTKDQTRLSQRLIAHRAQERAILQGEIEYRSVNGKELIPLTVGADGQRSAKPASWKIKEPANSLMFAPQAPVEDQGLTSVQQQKEAMSKAGPKQIVHENTRFPPSATSWQTDAEDDSTSIHTSFIVRRNAAGTDNGTVSGGETPRVNGYAFVDDEEPPPPDRHGPTYRDLLAGQTGDGTSNPFKIRQNSVREDLHHRLVDEDAGKKRARQKDVALDQKQVGNMTPAAQRMMQRLGGRTPQVGSKPSSRSQDWTPGATARRDRTVH